ncbi:DNA alkylation repair protein [Nanoarchaeota archaeon]
MLSKLKSNLQSLANPEKAKILQRFFKTGKGQYGEGDVFLGITVPDQRKVAREFIDLELKDVQELLNSEIHEYRLVGLIILTYQYKKYPEKQKDIFYFYLNNSKRVNNWDLVDLTAPNIVGDFLLKNYDLKKLIYDLASSENLWEKRIAIISTLAFIRNEKFEDVLAIAEILLNDSHDLIHKAVGWMLREVGKRDQNAEEKFLKKHYKNMPRTMLRYAIERFEEEKRKRYLRGEI